MLLKTCCKTDYQYALFASHVSPMNTPVSAIEFQSKYYLVSLL